MPRKENRRIHPVALYLGCFLGGAVVAIRVFYWLFGHTASAFNMKTGSPLFAAVSAAVMIAGGIAAVAGLAYFRRPSANKPPEVEWSEKPKRKRKRR